jgi:hypothetical protein
MWQWKLADFEFFFNLLTILKIICDILFLPAIRTRYADSYHTSSCPIRSLDGRFHLAPIKMHEFVSQATVSPEVSLFYAKMTTNMTKMTPNVMVQVIGTSPMPS